MGSWDELMSSSTTSVKLTSLLDKINENPKLNNDDGKSGPAGSILNSSGSNDDNVFYSNDTMAPVMTKSNYFCLSHFSK